MKRRPYTVSPLGRREIERIRDRAVAERGSAEHSRKLGLDAEAAYSEGRARGYDQLADDLEGA